MRIRKNENINDIPLIKIRNYFQKIQLIGISKADIRKYFSLDVKSMNCLIKELQKNDLIENALDKKGVIEYQLTTKGQSLCVARSVPPLNKAKADKFFNEFMQRVEDVNNNDYYLFKVEKVLLFGSYLNPNNADFGDIDVAIELKRKIDNFDEYNKIRVERVQEMKQNGKQFSNYGEELFYPENEVKLMLKNQCRYISLHSTDEKVLEIENFKQVYPINSVNC
jgi:predicted nucleotidyltransferase/predicted transcriptional regulator